ncbi:winged helix-turn-helix transcriptional regulator [Sphingobacterium spiritivorum]|uniref:winged helix-turn-helix transcriptional regulator n=1 Tax=Sphingobacterium spiritivorum TaxID=258 RepID=UPI003DA58799
MTKIKETSTNYENKRALIEECPEIYAANLIGGQWTIAICCYLENGKLRFGQLKKRMPAITERMLTLQLRKMEENELVKRTVYAEVPPRVEYELTAIGMELLPIIKQLEAWGRRHQQNKQDKVKIN